MKTEYVTEHIEILEDPRWVEKHTGSYYCDGEFMSKWVQYIPVSPLRAKETNNDVKVFHWYSDHVQRSVQS